MLQNNLIVTYFLVGWGIFLEGESSLITSVVASRMAYLNFRLVFLIAFFVTLLYDWLMFFLGRWKGKNLIEKNKKLNDTFHKFGKFIFATKILFLFLYRFLYGLRGIFCILFGISNIKTKQFLLFSSISIFIWTSLYSLIGYYTGKVLINTINSFSHPSLFFLLFAIILFCIFITISWFTSKKLLK